LWASRRALQVRWCLPPSEARILHPGPVLGWCVHCWPGHRARPSGAHNPHLYTARSMPPTRPITRPSKSGGGSTSWCMRLDCAASTTSPHCSICRHMWATTVEPASKACGAHGRHGTECARAAVERLQHERRCPLRGLLWWLALQDGCRGCFISPCSLSLIPFPIRVHSSGTHADFKHHHLSKQCV